MLALWPGMAGAQEWRALKGPEIQVALEARVLGFGDGMMQDFLADGRSLHGDQWGLWRVLGDRYCSSWPPSELWVCYDVAVLGLEVRFQSDAGDRSVGRYVDLN